MDIYGQQWSWVSLDSLRIVVNSYGQHWPWVSLDSLRIVMDSYGQHWPWVSVDSWIVWICWDLQQFTRPYVNVGHVECKETFALHQQPAVPA